MKYRVVNGFCLEPGRDVYPGDEVEIDEKQANILIYQRRIVPADGTAAVFNPALEGGLVTLEGDPHLESQDPDASHRDPGNAGE